MQMEIRKVGTVNPAVFKRHVVVNIAVDHAKTKKHVKLQIMEAPILHIPRMIIGGNVVRKANIFTKLQIIIKAKVTYAKSVKYQNQIHLKVGVLETRVVAEGKVEHGTVVK